MKENLYYDTRQGRFLEASDGVLWKDRMSRGESLFYLHELGFPVFLPLNLISSSDEYADGDPYRVSESIEGSFHRRRRDVTIELVKACASRSRVLDVGCGEGHISEAIRQVSGVESVVAIDYALTAVICGSRSYPQIEFSVGNAYSLPFAPAYFDVVVCNNLWEHVPDPLTLLNSLSRVLRPGGSLIISTPSRFHFGNLLRILRGRRPEMMSSHHVTEYTVGQVREQLSFGGFELVRAYSPVCRPDGIQIRSFLLHRILKPLLARFLRAIGSEHILEQTVFYLARASRSPTNA